jgi:hypothetical protein
VSAPWSARTAGHTDWKRVLALPIFVTGLGVGPYSAGLRLTRTRPRDPVSWWTDRE